jgi:hypothetical protein
LLIGLLAACSGIKPYPDIAEKNLQVRTSTDSGSIFSNVRASVSISRVDAQCRTEYEGTVELRKESVQVGIPVERWSYLVFHFSSSGFLSSTSSTIAQATLLKPSGAGTRIRLANSKRTVVDGPFAETKELIGGFAIFEVASKQEALDLAQRFVDAHVNAGVTDFEMEMRPLFGPEDFGQCA